MYSEAFIAEYGTKDSLENEKTPSNVLKGSGSEGDIFREL